MIINIIEHVLFPIIAKILHPRKTKVYKKSLKIPKGGNQNLYIEQTTQWPKEKVQKDKQRSTKHTHTINICNKWYNHSCIPNIENKTLVPEQQRLFNHGLTRVLIREY
jgi:hypothetical protein